MEELEIWKPVKGYEDSYLISNLGNIKSLPRYKVRKERLLKPYVGFNGYIEVSLCSNKKKRKVLTHRLMAENFLADAENKETVNHINGIKTDNRSVNLEWASYARNNKHAYDTKLKIPYKRCGTKNPKNKYTEEQVKDAKRLFNKGLTLVQVELSIPIPKSTLCNIRKGHTWAWLTV